MKATQSFTPDEFIDKLRRDDLSPPIVLFGMVKHIEDDDEYLMFANGYVCENWVRVPLSSIETIDFVSAVPCKEHTHPLVLLHMKQPQTDEGRLFSSLVKSTRARPRTPDRGASIMRGPRSFRPSRSFAADPNAGIGPDPRWPWCDSIPQYEILPDGTVQCLSWCWESAHTAVYTDCD